MPAHGRAIAGTEHGQNADDVRRYTVTTEPTDDTPAPLFDDDTDGKIIPLRLIRSIECWRLTVDEDGRPKPRTFKCALPSHTRLEQLHMLVGEGTFEFRVRQFNGAFGGGRVLTVEKPSGAHVRAARDGGAGPIFETPAGLAAVLGLDPHVQLMLAVLQQHTTQIREDAHAHSAALVEIVRAVVARPEAHAVSPDIQILSAMIERITGENRQKDKLLESEREHNVRLAIERERAKHKDASPLTTFANKLSDQMDLVAGVVASKMTSGRVTSADPLKSLMAGLSKPVIEVSAAPAAPLAPPPAAAPSADGLTELAHAAIARLRAAGPDGLPPDEFEALKAQLTTALAASGAAG